MTLEKPSTGSKNYFEKPVVAWLTDIHLNFVGRACVEKLCKSIQQSGATTVLLTGDIATAKNLCRYLDYLVCEIRLPIYFVLGNHDYYGSSIQQVNDDVAKVVETHHNLTWLSRAGVIELTSETCLIGHEGLADGRLGDPEGSTVLLSDYYQIEELKQPTKQLRLEVQHRLGDEAAAHLQKLLAIAVTRYRHIVVALHVPPFAEACWHEGNNTDDQFLPHFCCQATGEVLRATMLAHPEISMVVYCGHGHSAGETDILPNLRVITGAAEYRRPVITGVVLIDGYRDLGAYRCALAKMVIKLFDHWHLSAADRLELLGLSMKNRSILARFRNGQALPETRETLDRVGWLMSIHKGLGLLYPHNEDIRYSWINRRNKAFDNLTPLDIMREQGLLGIAKVARYIDNYLGQ